MKQPLLGIVASALVIAVSLVFISLWEFWLFSSWVAYVFLSLIPAQIMVAVLWKSDPPFLSNRRQPDRGVFLTFVTIVCGAVAGSAYFKIMGDAISPPTPMLAHCIIVSVVVMFWLSIIWGGWPFNAFIKNPVTSGLVTLVAAYVLNALLFRIFFNYGFMSRAEIYVSWLDPGGIFNAWSALVFYVTSLAVMFVLAHFDMWPLTKVSLIMRQPYLGILWTAISIAGGAALFKLGTDVFYMDTVQFLVRVPIPFIFGTIIVLNMLQNSLFAKLAQPLKGITNVLAAAVVGSALAQLFRVLEPTLSGQLAAGPPPYQFEIWLASALLSITFPLLIFFAEFFRFWPLKRD